MHNLERETAVAVMGILMTTEDEYFKKEISETMTTVSESPIICCSWQGTLLPDNVKILLDKEIGLEYLKDRNLISPNGDFIELFVLGEAMPPEFLANFARQNIENKLKRYGLSIGDVENLICECYRGKNDDGDYLLDFTGKNDFLLYLSAIGIQSFGRDGSFHKIYTNLNTFGVQTIRDILLRKGIYE